MGANYDFVTDGRGWREPGDTNSEPWLRVQVHDSDIGSLEYSPHFGGSGIAYVGVTARTYFDDPSLASTSKPLEVEALLRWFAAAGVAGDDLSQGLQELLAEDGEDLDGDLVEDDLARFFSATSLGSLF